MIEETRCETCNKLTMVALDEVHCAIYFASQWCKCSEEREPVSKEPPRDLSGSQFDQEHLGKFIE